ncbi:MAG: 50S ribosomal protein L34 [Patescibacteria group bacterium]
MGKILNLKNRKRKTTHGFLVRNKSANGKRVVRNRRRKGRKSLSV